MISVWSDIRSQNNWSNNNEAGAQARGGQTWYVAELSKNLILDMSHCPLFSKAQACDLDWLEEAC